MIRGPKHLRESLWQNGYRAVAIRSGTKFPTDEGWTDRARLDPPAAVTEPLDGSFPGTGILGDGLRPVDIDLSDESDVFEIATWTRRRFGDCPIRHRLNGPRLLLLFRAVEGSPGSARVWNASRGEKGEGVEVLGHGRQFFAYGRHPSGYDLQWVDDIGPHNVHRGQLPAISEEQVAELLMFARPIVGEAEAVIHQGSSAPVEAKESVSNFTLQEITILLDHIPLHHANDYHSWFDIGLAVYACNNSPDAYELWRAWSAQSPKYKKESCKQKWDSIGKDGVRSITGGTLLYYVRQHNPTFNLRRAILLRQGEELLASKKHCRRR